jgi:hypothetical protein
MLNFLNSFILWWLKAVGLAVLQLLKGLSIGPIPFPAAKISKQHKLNFGDPLKKSDTTEWPFCLCVIFSERSSPKASLSWTKLDSFCYYQHFSGCNGSEVPT